MKNFHIFFSLIVALLAGCGVESDSTVTPAGVLPIVKERVTLTAVAPLGVRISSYQAPENKRSQWLENKTNIHLDWNIIPEKDYSRKLEILLASGTYPGIIFEPTLSKEQLTTAASEGKILPLDDYIEKYGINTKKIFEKYPMAKVNMTLPDGKIYALPKINDCYHCSMPVKMWIYQPWLDALALEIPRTTDELYSVLKSFKEGDPNGNGLADEIPLVAATSGWYTSIEGFIMNAFIYDDLKNRLIVKEDKIDAVFDESEWQDGLRFLHKLFIEGLIADVTFLQEQKYLKELVEKSKAPTVGMVPAGSLGQFTQIKEGRDRWLKFSAVTPLTGPSGYRVTGFYPVYGIMSFLITDNCKNPEAAFRMADYLYNQEATLRSTYGRPGMEWDWAKPGEVGINGLPAIWKTLVPRGDIPNNVWWDDIGPGFRPRELRLGRVHLGEKSLEVILYNATKESYEPYKVDSSMLVPPLTFSVEQTKVLIPLQKSINVYVDEMIIKFIMGEADIENDWNNYLENLKSLGLAQYLALYQQTFETFKAAQAKNR